MENQTQATLISSGILDDVNLILGIDPYSGGASKEYFWPRNPSAWEVAYFLIRLATYVNSLVFFDKVEFIRFPTPIPLQAHLNFFTNENILQPTKEQYSINYDESHETLVNFVKLNLYTLKGFQGLFRNTISYKDFDDEDRSDYYASQLIATYWASEKYGYRYLAHAFETPAILYGINQGINVISQNKIDESISTKIAMNYINNKRKGILAEEMESASLFEISLPPILTLAILEAEDFRNLLEIVINIRKEAVSFRRKMYILDEAKAPLPQIKEAIAELENEGSILSKIISNVSLGSHLSIISLKYPADKLLAPKKNFLTLLSQTIPRRSVIARKITKLFYKSDLTVDGNQVVCCLRTFFDK
ncbi:MAG: hypothetical protein DM484_01890 [Candidatus Methylumidiphilus alinenensis]|uniref:Uncharacterized protein n=1 Tax=Candidatus Methylumidiphilus alinenensis TaxID=2202197 RepID=A0A2W4RQ19_9GAMM|nr:MAG: hypothetical protein DM484_01890 [Candidatus Methylumidiphilus alinenensis]